MAVTIIPKYDGSVWMARQLRILDIPSLVSSFGIFLLRQTILSIPVIIVYLIFQKRFIAGIAGACVKG